MSSTRQVWPPSVKLSMASPGFARTSSVPACQFAEVGSTVARILARPLPGLPNLSGCRFSVRYCSGGQLSRSGSCGAMTVRAVARRLLL